MRFTYGEKHTEVSCYFDETDGSLVCRTPMFIQPGDESNELQLPCDCQLSVTLDGQNYSECEESFKIYSNDILLTSVNPKCGSVVGGSTVTLSIEIDDVTAQCLQQLKIGFQPKAKKMTTDSSKHKTSTIQNSHQNESSTQQLQRGEEADNWTTAEGFYENGKIIATVPHLSGYDPEQMVYSVDVALNGQQFTGKPVNFRYYDVKIEKIEPDFGPQAGGTSIFICGQGLYDAPIKKVKFATADQ